MKYITKTIVFLISATFLLIGFAMQSGAGYGISSIFITPTNIIFLLFYFISLLLFSRFIISEKSFNKNSQFSARGIIVIFLICNGFQYKYINKHEINIKSHGYETTLNKNGCGRSLITANSLYQLPFGEKKDSSNEFINRQATSLSFSLAHKKNPVIKQLVNSCNEITTQENSTCNGRYFYRDFNKL